MYTRLARTRADVSDPASLTRLNSRVAPFGWLMALCCAVPALLFWGETRWLVAASFLFCGVYVALYLWLSFSSRSRHGTEKERRVAAPPFPRRPGGYHTPPPPPTDRRLSPRPPPPPR